MSDMLIWKSHWCLKLLAVSGIFYSRKRLHFNLFCQSLYYDYFIIEMVIQNKLVAINDECKGLLLNLEISNDDV